MTEFAEILALLGLLAWIGLVWFRGEFWRGADRLEAPPPGARPGQAGLPRVAVLVPARNEAETIARCVACLVGQRYRGRVEITVVDDSSEDGTGDLAAEAARRAGGAVSVLRGRPLPAGWTGKLWALHQGTAQNLDRPDAPEFFLFVDADIDLPHDTIEALVHKAESEGLDLASVMVRLRCENRWEKLLIPPFIFFFQKLYPFPWVRNPARRTAAAAGGCLLIRRRALAAIGGVGAVRGAIIDDCSFARAVKNRGGRIWLGHGLALRSLRPYRRLSELWNMVARTAYAELRHSPLMLAACIVGMTLAYVAPVAAALGWAVHGSPLALGAGTAALALMARAYLPTVRQFGLPAWQVLLLPLAAALYLAMTIDSAQRHWRGRGGGWKGRTYGAPAPSGTYRAGWHSRTAEARKEG